MHPGPTRAVKGDCRSRPGARSARAGPFRVPAKTTVALQFILEGVRRNEPVIYFALSESRSELDGVAASHGWSLEAANVHEVVAVPPGGEPEEPYTLFHPSEVELNDTIKAICRE